MEQQIMSLNKEQRKQEVAKVAAIVAKEMVKGIDAEHEAHDDGKLAQVNKDGTMLLCTLNVAKRLNAPDPLCVTINEEFRWIKRGANVVVPWYVCEHLSLNIERKYRQEKDEQGKNIVVHDDMLAEPFTFTMIDPAPGSKVAGVTA